MNKILVALTFALLTAQVFASEETEVMAGVQQLVDAFNKSDTKSLLAVCADEMCIIDEFAPYEWHGPRHLLEMAGGLRCGREEEWHYRRESDDR